MSLEKPNAGKSVQQFKGLLLLSSSFEYNSGCPSGNSVTEKKTLAENLVRLPHSTLQIMVDLAAELTVLGYNCVAPSQ